MYNAIVIIRDDQERKLAKTPYRGGNLLFHTIKQLHKLIDLGNIYVAGSDIDAPGCIRVDDVSKALKQLPEEGRVLLLSPLYPDLDDDDLKKLIAAEGPAVLVCEDHICDAFILDNRDLARYQELDFAEIAIENKKVNRYSAEDEVDTIENNLEDVVVFALTSSVEVTEEVCRYLNIRRGEVSIKHFADGETLVELGQSVRGKQVYIIQSTSKPVNETLMEVLICLDACRRSSAAEITCIIPYFGYARQDRKAQPRQPITAKLVASMLEQAGANRVVTFDLHAAQIQGFFHCPVDDLTAVPMMGQYFRSKNLDPKDLVVVSPDHGGVKRARIMAEIMRCPLAIIDKRRPQPNVAEACHVVGEVDGKHAIIVDDIIDTGGSLIAAANIIRERGVKDIYVCVTHGMFSNNAAMRIQDSPIKEVVVTNTVIPYNEDMSLTNKVTTLSIGWMLSKLILAVSCHTPVSDVYALYE